MAVSAADLHFRLSVRDAIAGMMAGGDPATSLGGFMATTEITDGELHNLFGPVTGEDNAERRTEYRCIFVHNSHFASMLLDAVVTLSSAADSVSDVAIGLDRVAAMPEDAKTPQALVVSSVVEAPAGVNFVAPGKVLRLGHIPPLSARAVWIRRRATGQGPRNRDSTRILVSGDTVE